MPHLICQSSFSRRNRCVVVEARSVRGFTLIELLVAMTVTLLLLGSVVSLFSFLGDTVNDSKTDIEMLQRVRHTRDLLQADLESLTLQPVPARAGSPQRGFFEYIEGIEREWTVVVDPTNVNTDTRMGDRDDILHFTIQSQAESFVGRFNGGGVESRTAEVMWFVTGSSSANPTDLTKPPLRLHRYQLLIAPAAATIGADPATYFASNDVSAHLDDSSNVVTNSLEDLSERENRRGRSGMRNPVIPTTLNLLVDSLAASGRLEETVVLSNILAFDVRAWDPGAPVGTVTVATTGAGATTGMALQPGDPGYAAAVSSGQIADYGAYVDLFNYLPAGYTLATNAPMPLFNHTGNPNSGLAATSSLPATYDTWSPRYATDGNGLDGFDNDGSGNNGLGGVDDASEQAAFPPPYLVPLEGIQIVLRVFEPSSRTVRSVTIQRSF